MLEKFETREQALSALEKAKESKLKKRLDAWKVFGGGNRDGGLSSVYLAADKFPDIQEQAADAMTDAKTRDNLYFPLAIRLAVGRDSGFHDVAGSVRVIGKISQKGVRQSAYDRCSEAFEYFGLHRKFHKDAVDAGLDIQD